MTPKLIDIRCSCGKLLGRVQEGAAHEHKCPRCKAMTAKEFAEAITVTAFDENLLMCNHPAFKERRSP